jgi:hypothetical protein
MDIFTLSQRLHTLREQLGCAEVYGPSVELSMWTGGHSAIRLEVSYRETDDFDSKHHEFIRKLTKDEVDGLYSCGKVFGGNDWLDQAMQDAQAWISDIPSPEEREHKQFTAALGRLIDQGRDLGIEVDFLNPLTQMMEKLAFGRPIITRKNL